MGSEKLLINVFTFSSASGSNAKAFVTVSTERHCVISYAFSFFFAYVALSLKWLSNASIAATEVKPYITTTLL